MAQGQNLPYISTPTIIPQSPTSADVIKIVTRVTTPNQGIVVDQATFSVSANPKEINIRGCYWNGMLTALQDYVDTFTIGQLPAGTYAIKHKAYLSSGQQVCHRTDSNMVMFNLTVNTITGIQKQQASTLKLFPNPARDVIHLQENHFTIAEILSYDARVLKTIPLHHATEIDIHDLAQGLYFVRLSDGDKRETFKVVKR